MGSSRATKLCSNLISYVEFAAVFEDFRLARQAGAPYEALTAVTRAHGVMTPTMRSYVDFLVAPVAGEPSDAQGEEFVEMGKKNLDTTLQMARDLGESLPATALCSQLIAEMGALHARRSRG